MNFPPIVSRISFVITACLLFDAPVQAAQTANVIAYVANAGNNNVQLLDVQSGETLNKLYTGAAPWRLVVSPDGKRLIVQHWYSETSAVVNLANNTIEKILPVRGPSVFDPKGKQLWSQSWPATQLVSFDAKTFGQAKAYGGEDKLVYDMVFWQGNLAKGQYNPMNVFKRQVFDSVLIAPADNPKSLSAATRSGASPAKLVVDPTGTFLLTANHDDDSISMLNELGDGRRITLAPGPRDIVFNKNGKQMIVIAWARNAQDSDIFTLDVNFKTRPWPDIKANHAKHMRGGFVDAQMGPDGLLYVLDRPGKRLLAFNPDTLEQVKSLAVGDEPWAFVLRKVSSRERKQLAQKTKARQQLEGIIAKVKAQTAVFRDVSFTETLTQVVHEEEADTTQSGDKDKNKDKGKKEAKAKPVTSTVKTSMQLPDSVRQEIADGTVRLALGGEVITVNKEGRYRDTPRQELLHVLYLAGGMPVDDVIRQLAGDVPGSPFLRNGIATDIVSIVKEGGHKFYAIGADRRAEFVSQLWVDEQTGLPVSLVEQYPIIRAKNPHSEVGGFRGFTETKLHYHETAGRMFPIELTRYLDGAKLGTVALSDIKFDQTPTPRKFDLTQLGGVLKPVVKTPKSVKDAAGGPGTAVESLGTAHVDSPFDEHPEYNTNPPTSGHHTHYAADIGVHKQPIPPEVQVGNLINGAVLLQYNCPQACPDMVRQLEAVAEKYDDVIVAPYPLMESKIALTAWQRIEILKDFDEKRITDFTQAYAGKRHVHNKEDMPEDDAGGDMMMPPNHPPTQGAPQMSHPRK